MLRLYSAAATITVLSLVSCAGSDNNNYIDKSVIPEGKENATIQQPAPASNMSNTPVIPGVNPVSVPTQVNSLNSNAQNTVITAPQVLTGNLNPAHGQPGHRCDIAEGAPLNGTPAAGTQPKITSVQQPTQNNTVITQQPVQNTATGMNPAHGQPGHRCDIAVGAPLNSPPSANPAQPQVITTQQPAQNTVDAQQANQKVAAGMNPAHGEPGHRCDIAVGAPLNSKPAATAAPVKNTTAVPPLLAPVKPDSSKN